MCEGAQYVKTDPKTYAKHLRLVMDRENLDPTQMAKLFKEWQVNWLDTPEAIISYLEEHYVSERKFLNPKVARAVISAFDDGTIFSVVFEKKDGQLRRMVCRTGVHSHLAGGKATYDSDKNIGVWDTEAPGNHVDATGNPIVGDYRCFAHDRVLRIKGGGNVIEACNVGEIEDPIVNARGEEVTVK